MPSYPLWQRFRKLTRINMSVSQEKPVIICCLILVVATLAFYNPIVHNQFTDFDDSAYILKNSEVQAGLTWNTVKWSFTTFHAGYWQPLTWMSHALDCRIFGLNPAGHHYTNLLLHAVNAVLLFLLLRRATGFTWSSLLVASLFALHPVNVESVAWAAERKNVLSMLFFLLALLAYDRYARTRRQYLYWSVTLLFALGLMAKPQIVTLPFVLLLWDYWPLQRMGAAPVAEASPPPCAPRSFSFLLWEKTPLFVLAAAASVVAVMAQRAGNAVRTAAEVPLPTRLENAIVCYVRYMGKALWPSRLAPLYPHPGNTLSGWQVAGAAALLLAVSALILRRRRRRYLLVGWCWFLGTLVPMIGIVAVGEQAMADRFAYIPLIGLFVAVVWFLDAVASEYRIPKTLLAAAGALAVVSLGCLSYRQLSYWHDDETLWRYTLSVTGRNYMAHDNLAFALKKQGRSDEAVFQFRAAEQLHKYPPVQVLALALYELQVGHPQEAVEECNSVLHASSDPKVQSVAWIELGQAYFELRRYDQAAAGFENALRLTPESDLALIGSGLVALRQAQDDLAVVQFDHATKVEPSAVNYLLLAQALRRAGRPAEAASAWAQAQKISPDLAQAQIVAAQYLSLAGLKPL